MKEITVAIAVVSFLFCSVSTASGTSTSNSKYIIVLPKALVRSDSYEFFVQTDMSNFVVEVIATHKRTNQEQPALSKTVVSRHGRLNFTIPFKNYKESTIALQFRIFNCEQSNATECGKNPGNLVFTDSATMPMIKDSLLIFTDSSKPIYKPEDSIQFRLLPLYIGNLRPYGDMINLTLDRITLEAPDGTVMAQWLNIPWMKAFSGFSFKLTRDPVFGKWKIKAQALSQTDEEEIEVRKYALPRFLVELRPPTFILINAQRVQFSVCAKYPTGLPMKGKVEAKLCFRPIRTYRKRPCLKVTGILNGLKSCINFNKSTTALQLDSRSYSHHSNYKPYLNATVTEMGTNTSITKVKDAGKLSSDVCRIEVEVRKLYNPGLPTYGTIKTINPDGSPFPNASITVSISQNSNWWGYRRANVWGYELKLVTDDEGVVNFVTRPVPSKLKYIHLSVKSHVKIFRTNRQRSYRARPMAQANKYVRISAATSTSNGYLQLYPLTRMEKQYPCESNKLKIRLQSNIALNKKRIQVIISSGGSVKDTQIMSRENISSQQCSDLNSDDLGHYKCLRMENGRKIIRCLPGWSGPNCLTALCRHCVKGVCVQPQQCLCQRGWSGPACTICKRRTGCVHGYCARGNDCVCYPGWYGYRCQRRWRYNWHRRRYYHRQTPVRELSLPAPRKIISNEEETTTIFERDIVLRIKHSYGPVSYITLFAFVGEEDRSQVMTVDAKLENLASCQEKKVPTSFSFDNQVVRPGENITGKIKTTGNDVKCALSLRDVALDVFSDSVGVSLSGLTSKITTIMNRLTEVNIYDLNTDRSKLSCPSWQRIQPRRLNLRDPRSSFDRNGLFILTNSISFTPRKECYGPFPIIMENAMFGLAGSGGGGLMIDARRGRGRIKESIRRKNFRFRQRIQHNKQPIKYKKKKPKRPSMKQSIKQKIKKIIKPRVRKFFPEAWKFDVLNNPGTTINLTVPDSITNWRSNMYCVSSAGLGIARPRKLLVFQPFFLQIALPYSVIRGESVNIPVKIFSYMTTCFLATLSVSTSSRFQVIGFKRHTMCLCALQQRTVRFTLKPSVLGRIPLEVTARAEASTLCPNPAGAPNLKKTVNDAVRRLLLVEPEGVPQELTMGDIVCPKGKSQAIVLGTAVPLAHLVPQSARGYLTWSGEILSATVDNLDSLVRLPTGCGEQNMISLVPSIYVLNYFIDSKIQKPNIIEKAKRYIDYGYKRELKYRHPDGSYSAFGPSHGAKGSTWLTAFVLKSFVAASRYVDIPTKPLISALDFLQRKQDKISGCFKELGRVFHSNMKGGINGSPDEISLSVYVLGALLEAGMHPKLTKYMKENVIENAVACINASTPLIQDKWAHLSTYAIALRAYVLTQWSSDNDLTLRHHAQLNERAVTMDGYRFWENSNTSPQAPNLHKCWRRSTAANVETTAYAVLAKMNKKNRNLPDLLSSLRWLINERNEFGGWYSTQDTVIALQCLAEASFFLSASGEATRLRVSVDKNGLSSGTPVIDQVSPSDKIVLRKHQVRIHSNFTMNVNGTGCLIFQLSLLYNIAKIGKASAPFDLQAKSNSVKKDCSLSRVIICVRYVGKESQSNMAIVKIKMASGWVVSGRTIYTLRKSIQSGVFDRVDVEKDGVLNLYFDSLSKRKVCLELFFERLFFIEDLRPTIIQVYDYYQPEKIQERPVSLYSGHCASTGGRPLVPATTTTPSPMTCPHCAETLNKTDVSLVEEMCRRNDSSMIGAVQRGEEWDMMSQIDGLVGLWTAPIKFSSANCTCVPPQSTLFISYADIQIEGKGFVLNGDWIVVNAANVHNITALKVNTNCETALRHILP